MPLLHPLPTHLHSFEFKIARLCLVICVLHITIIRAITPPTVLPFCLAADHPSQAISLARYQQNPREAKSNPFTRENEQKTTNKMSQSAAWNVSELADTELPMPGSMHLSISLFIVCSGAKESGPMQVSRTRDVTVVASSSVFATLFASVFTWTRHSGGGSQKESTINRSLRCCFPLAFISVLSRLNGGSCCSATSLPISGSCARFWWFVESGPATNIVRTNTFPDDKLVEGLDQVVRAVNNAILQFSIFNRPRDDLIAGDRDPGRQQSEDEPFPYQNS